MSKVAKGDVLFWQLDITNIGDEFIVYNDFYKLPKQHVPFGNLIIERKNYDRSKESFFFI